MSLTNDDIIGILKLIDESGYDDVRLEIGDTTLAVQKHGAEQAPLRPAFPGHSAPAQAPAPVARTAAPAPPHSPPATAAAPRQEPIPEGMVAIRSPMLGTFFRAPSPGEKPFVEVGARVGPADTVCLVEVMKLFNSVKAGAAGTVFKVLAENCAMVEHDQVLMLIKPD